MIKLLAPILLAVGLFAQPAKPAPGEIVPWQAQFQAIAGDLWPWRAAQVKAESAFNSAAKSPVGALGPAQFMPATWRWCRQQGWIQADDQPQDIVPALTAQHRYMTWIHPRAGHDKDATNASYNAGLGNIRKAQTLARDLGLPGPGAWLQALPQVTGLHARETQDYVTRIRRFELEIRARLMEVRP